VASPAFSPRTITYSLQVQDFGHLEAGRQGIFYRPQAHAGRKVPHAAVKLGDQ
jgi:hypothetical protein